MAKSKRVRPADGGLVWLEKWHAFECYGCGEFEEVRKARDRTPARLAELRELYVADHTECWEFDDVDKAKDARRHRSEKKRRAIVAAVAGASGVAVHGTRLGLAAFRKRG